MKRLLPILWLGCLFAATLTAQEMAGEALPGAEKEVVIPVSHASGRYEPTWSRSPFSRAVPVPPKPASWALNWELTGMYRGVTGKVTLNLKNIKTGAFKQVTSDGTGEFKLVSASINRNRDQSFAELEKDGVKAVLTYGPIQP